MDQHLFDAEDEFINDLNIQIATLKSDNLILFITLEELTMLMDDTVAGIYRPDSFTTQPAHKLIEAIKDKTRLIRKEAERMKENEHP